MTWQKPYFQLHHEPVKTCPVLIVRPHCCPWEDMLAKSFLQFVQVMELK